MSISRIGNGTTQACAACKYQRRKCAPDCILAPYFPHNRQRQFLNAHKLFGVSNITKIIKNLEPPEKEAAMNTIIFQSDARANDPVGGCYRIILELQRQIEYSKAELDLVLHQLAICRTQAAAQIQMQETNIDSSSTIGCDTSTVNADVLLNAYNPMPYHYIQAQQEQQQYMMQNNHQLQQQQQQQRRREEEEEEQQQQQGEEEEEEEEAEDVNAWVVLQDSMLHVRQQQPFVNECIIHDVKPIVEMPRERVPEIKFEPDQDFVDRRFVPSTQLVISS
ncbi:DUF260 domain-containing protein [Cephalotus follicularis]|uniref:DUF260 domain-containing protein n=1 Tax=Cephalotus follicularis TaxID=3775 RepID=A0A1Q3DDM4_CEPFO|nr:DUF260 domain-containing protein [Cephalotus follicularis]